MSDRAHGDPPLLSVRNLRKHYPIRRGLLKREVGRVRAVDGIDFTVRRGETVGLVGESGCGKSTAASTLLRLEEPTVYDPDVVAAHVDPDPSVLDRLLGYLGRDPDPTADADEVPPAITKTRTRVEFDGEDITTYDRAELKRFRRKAQMVFQDPTSSFDPRMTVGESVGEPLVVHGMTDRDRRHAIVRNLLERVGLAAEDADRYPHEFSGGQKQRVALARALVVNPDLIVADEPVSALDVSIQANILSLMQDVQAEFGLGLLFISHDMSVVRQVCDRVAVMYLGEIIELGPTEELFTDPRHPYTRALLSSIPVADPRRRSEAVELVGDVPSPSNPPTGCRFHTRCPEVIRPDGQTLDREAYRRVVHLRDQLRTGGVDVTAMRETVAIREGLDVTEVDPPTVAAELRTEYDLPDELDDPEAEATLSAALSSVARGDVDDANRHLRETFSTVCERERPQLTELGTDHVAACHLNDGTPTEPVPGFEDAVVEPAGDD